MGHPQDLAVKSDVFVPAIWNTGLDGDPVTAVGRQHLFSVGRLLGIEHRGGGHGDNTDFMAVVIQGTRRFQGEVDFRSGGQENEFRCPGAVQQDISAPFPCPKRR